MSFNSNHQAEEGLFGSTAPSASPSTVSSTEAREEVIGQCNVTVHDVLLGRGRGPNMHPGNQRYREIIYANRENYNKASNRTEQTRITREIVNHIKSNGRFLKRLEVPKSQKKKKKRGESSADCWVVVSDATARLKVGQCLRYKLRQDAEQQDDGSIGDEGYGEVIHPGSTEKYSGGAIIPRFDKPSVAMVEAEPILSEQPSRKYRKVQVKEEPALDAEEMQVLKSFNTGFVPEEDDEDLDGFVESPMWEAKAESHVLPVEDEPESQGSFTGSYYDSMFGYGDSYDSNYAYGNELISDAEVLNALGYPQAPTQPSKRAPVICYCGCRLNAANAQKHRHQCVPRQGIFAMPGASPSGRLGAPRTQTDTLMGEPQENNFCGIIGTNNNGNTIVNNNTNFTSMVTPSDNLMTPMMGNSGWNAPMQSAPIQSAPIQSAPPGQMSMPFQVPDSAPVSRPRLYRPFMQNVS